MQPDMKRLVTSRLKYLTNVGTLVKVKRDTLIEIFCLLKIPFSLLTA